MIVAVMIAAVILYNCIVATKWHLKIYHPTVMKNNEKLFKKTSKRIDKVIYSMVAANVIFGFAWYDITGDWFLFPSDQYSFAMILVSIPFATVIAISLFVLWMKVSRQCEPHDGKWKEVQRNDDHSS